MNKIISFVVLTTLLSQVVQAQVKRQYKDEKYAKQTVVVKEKASTSDLDILNSQFDLDEVPIGEVIRITTETDSKRLAEVPEQAAEVAVAEEPIVALVPELPEETTKVEQEETSPVVNARPARINSLSVSYNTSRKSKKRFKNPRFKKKKRKRVRRSKDRCYRF